MSKLKDEQFSAEVEKRLKNLFKDGNDEQFITPSAAQGDGLFSSKEEAFEEISEENLLRDEVLEEDSLDEISQDELLDDEFKEDSLEDSHLKRVNSEHEDVSITEDGEFQFYPLRLLKSIILSIDWEITDDVMDRFVGHVNGLMETYKADRIVLIFLHLLWELGKYIKKHRGQSHPNSIKTLNSVYNSLEKVLSKKDLSDVEKKKILSVEMIKFKTLKEQIALQHIDSPKKEAISHGKEAKNTDGMVTDTTISNELIEIIKKTVRDEVKALIKEFAAWANKR